MKRASVWVYQSHQSFDNIWIPNMIQFAHYMESHSTLIFMILILNCNSLKVSPTDHSYDGLDDSSQGSTALAQVKLQHPKSKKLRWMIYKISVLQYCFAPGSLKGELELHSLTSTPSWIQVLLTFQLFNLIIIHLFQLGVVSRRIHGRAQYRMEKTTEERGNSLAAMKQIFW